MRELRDHGVTVVLTTHAMDEAEQLCDRLAIVDHGRIVGCGTPAELTATAAADETRFSAPPDLDRAGLAARARPRRRRTSGSRARASTSSPARDAGAGRDLAAWLRDRDVTLGELRAGRRSLEEVFLRLTSEDRP